MKKNTRLDTRGFLLIETLLVSLTIAGILLYMYVQYSRITDSYHRLSQYNSVEKLYRARCIKDFLANSSADVYSLVDRSGGIYKIERGSKIGTLSFNDNLWNQDLNLSLLYIVKGNVDIGSNKIDSSFVPFLKTLSEVSDDTYQLLVKYTDGSFASVILKGE